MTQAEDYRSTVSDGLFPSGPWVGFYNYVPGDRHRMDLHLTFVNGSISGDGNDDVGRFLIRGGYDPASRECHWTKTYPGSHDVYYRGFREGKGIWGTWEIGLLGHGGFHIWPKGAAQGEVESASAEATVPVEAVGSEAATRYPGESQGGANYPLAHSANRRLRLARSQTMSNAEIKPTGKAGTKPVDKAGTKPVEKAETKPVGKAETRQAGKGSKRRPYKAKQFAANYEAIRWGKRQSKRPNPSIQQVAAALQRKRRAV